MNTHHTSRRARRYPAAGAAMRGFVVIERCQLRIKVLNPRLSCGRIMLAAIA